uniref:Uncharacterized protein n=1 Tax=Schizaphis graminum TaxID=13262 RepID=A0A2S2PMA6_SCHGA
MRMLPAQIDGDDDRGRILRYYNNETDRSISSRFAGPLAFVAAQITIIIIIIICTFFIRKKYALGEYNTYVYYIITVCILCSALSTLIPVKTAIIILHIVGTHCV